MTTALWVGLGLVAIVTVAIAVAGERLRRDLRTGRNDTSSTHSLWRKLFRGPRA